MVILNLNGSLDADWSNERTSGTMAVWFVIIGLALIGIYDVIEQRKWEQLAQADRRRRAAQRYLAVHGHLVPGYDANGNKIQTSSELIPLYPEREYHRPLPNK
jgi:hypothetical protein